MIKLSKKVYQTYAGDSERHGIRLISFIVVAIIIAVFAKVIDENSLAMMSVAISVLTGFTFTSLFSNNISATTDLPAPKNETDRYDIEILGVLEKNFESRAKFLIAMSMVSIMIMVFLSISINPKKTVHVIVEFIIGKTEENKFNHVYNYGSKIWIALAFLMRAGAMFVFFEVVYTFYRLSETVIAVLEKRGAYRSAHRG